MKKRLLSLLVSLCLLLSVFPVSASAASYSGSCGKNVSYSLVNGVMTISGTGAMDGYGFYNSDIPWYDYGDQIQSIVIEEGITEVGANAFCWCTNVTSVKLPSTLKKIQQNAFYGCQSLTAITLPDGLEEIRSKAFSGSGIQSIVVPDSVKSLEMNALDGCGKLTTAVIGKQITNPAGYLFQNCYQLESVTFRGKLERISYAMFENCTALKTFPLPDSVTKIEGKAFENSGLTEIQLGNNITEIGEYAFAGTKLEQIVIPDSVETLPRGAFDHCNQLVSIDFGDLEDVPGNTISLCSRIGNITVTGKMGSCVLKLMDNIGSTGIKVNYLGTKDQWARYYEDGNVRYPKNVHFDDHAHRSVKGERTIRDCEDSWYYPFTCTVCGKTKEFAVSPLGHSYAETVLVEPTYYTTGKNQYTCTRCGDTYECETPEKEPFEDVVHSSFYRDAVIWATEQGITTGVDAAHFQPNSQCTRGQAVTFLWRSVGKPEYSKNAPQFEDVGENRFCYDSVSWAVENGVTKGMDGVHFAPDAACTRGQIVTFLWRSAGCPEPTGAEMPFQDVKSGSYCETAVQWAVENGITKGVKADQFQPNEVCTRAQIVTFLYRYESTKGETA